MKPKILTIDIGLQVTDTGVVYLPDGQEKHQYLVGGYPCIKYKQIMYRVHRLVGGAFLPNPENKSDINHKDGNKLNNNVDNLEWATRSENIYHSLRTGLHDETETPVIGKNKRTGDIVLFPSQAEAGKSGLALQPNINKVLKGLRKTAGGYHWEYEYGAA